MILQEGLFFPDKRFKWDTINVDKIENQLDKLLKNKSIFTGNLAGFKFATRTEFQKLVNQINKEDGLDNTEFDYIFFFFYHNLGISELQRRNLYCTPYLSQKHKGYPIYVATYGPQEKNGYVLGGIVPTINPKKKSISCAYIPPVNICY